MAPSVLRDGRCVIACETTASVVPKTPQACVGPLRREGSGGGAAARAQRSGELCARGDAQLWEDAVQVGLDGPMRDIEPLADLTVREPLRSHLHDLQLLRRKLVERVARPSRTAFA